MPRPFEGPLPERPERNSDLMDRLADLFDRPGPGRPGDGLPVRGEGPGPWLQDFFDRGNHERTLPTFDPPSHVQVQPRNDFNDIPQREVLNDLAGGDASQRPFAPFTGSEDVAEFMARPGVRDLIKTHEFTHDWLFP